MKMICSGVALPDGSSDHYPFKCTVRKCRSCQHGRPHEGSAGCEEWVSGGVDAGCIIVCIPYKPKLIKPTNRA